MAPHIRSMLFVVAVPFVWLSNGAEAARDNCVSLLTHWTADRTYADSSGNGHDAVGVGSVGFRPGVANSAFDFVPPNYLEVPTLANGAGLNVDEFTVVLWFHEDVYSSAGSLVNLRRTGNDSGFTLEPQFNTPGTLLWAVHTTNDYQFLSIPYGLVGSTTFVAATFNGAASRMTGYVNGVAVANLTTSEATPCRLAGNEVFRMGVNAVNDSPLDGFTDDIQIYNNELSAAAIEFLFTHPGADVSTRTPPPDLNGDDLVNAADLAVLLGAWGACDPREACPADLDCDADVDAADLAIILGAWSV